MRDLTLKFINEDGEIRYYSFKDNVSLSVQNEGIGHYFLTFDQLDIDEFGNETIIKSFETEVFMSPFNDNGLILILSEENEENGKFLDEIYHYIEDVLTKTFEEYLNSEESYLDINFLVSDITKEISQKAKSFILSTYYPNEDISTNNW